MRTLHRVVQKGWVRYIGIGSCLISQFQCPVAPSLHQIFGVQSTRCKVSTVRYSLYNRERLITFLTRSCDLKSCHALHLDAESS
ncbi:hypothetical protein EI94DRAFT_1620937 [Lactarius quietus]|nr:hypothetical protein EI94DRAFT_1633630 [Lactarius quietus]KAF8258652.1 hypothetical protein EI94DRAFT_1620937 [Lactarius quietus]